MKKVLQFRDKWMNQHLERACAVYAIFYDGEYKRALKMHKEGNLSHYKEEYYREQGVSTAYRKGLAEEFPNVVYRYGDACFATLRLGSELLRLKAPHAYLEKQNKKKHNKLFQLLTKSQNPAYLVMDIRSMGAVGWTTLQKLGHKQPPEYSYEKYKKEGEQKDVVHTLKLEEYFNEMLNTFPWVKDSLVDAKTFEDMWNKGVVIDCRKLTLQQTFVIAMAIRFPLEHQLKYVEVVSALLSKGFTKKQASVLGYFIGDYSDGKFYPTQGGGHGFSCAYEMGRFPDYWKAIMRGDWVPAWCGGSWADKSFDGFKATSSSQAYEEGASIFSSVGEGWQRRNYIDLKKLKGLV